MSEQKILERAVVRTLWLIVLVSIDEKDARVLQARTKNVYIHYMNSIIFCFPLTFFRFPHANETILKFCSMRAKDNEIPNIFLRILFTEANKYAK